MEQLKILRTNKEINELIAYLADKEYVCFDTETSGLTNDDHIIGYSICAEDDVAYYVVTAKWLKEEQKLVFLETADSAKTVMEVLQTKKLIMHNGIFDCNMVEQNYRIPLIESLYCDTMIAAHLADENRSIGLKELGYQYFGATAKAEADAMKASITANGGSCTKASYELYKADSELIALYGAKDALLTWKIAPIVIQELIEQGLDKFFFEDESMPLLRGPTWQLNTTGLKVDFNRLSELQKQLETEILELKAFIYNEIDKHIKDKYPGTGKTNVFNIGSVSQLAWLLFDKLGNTFLKVSLAGQELCKDLDIRVPYLVADKRNFIDIVKSNKDREFLKLKDGKPVLDLKGQPKKYKIRDYWNYLSVDQTVLNHFAKKYRWVESLLEYKKASKMLSTYVEGIRDGQKYGVIRPQFLQHGTTSGRYSSRSPNFQNLPGEDKRVKACIVARPGKVFVGMDYSQLEPRVFASISGDKALQACFESGEDFYSVVGAPIFGHTDCSLVKDHPNSFAKRYPQLRDRAKVLALATPYGRTARQQASAMGISFEESQDLINGYFNAYPKVLNMMLNAYETVKRTGEAKSIFGRPRRIPEAKKIVKLFGNVSHEELPYNARSLLNLAVNHPIQSTGASIINRSSIALYRTVKETGIDCQIVMQIHDELVVECKETDAELVGKLLKQAMLNTVSLPGVKLDGEPKIGKNLADLK